MDLATLLQYSPSCCGNASQASFVILMSVYDNSRASNIEKITCDFLNEYSSKVLIKLMWSLSYVLCY